MQLYIFAALLVVVALNMAYADHPSSECCAARKYKVPISLAVAPPKDPKKPWQYAVRVGQILYLTSLRAFDSFGNRTIIPERGTYKESLWIMDLAYQILDQAGCHWTNVHDVEILVTGGSEEYPEVDKAINRFCELVECAGFPWAGHLRSTLPLPGGAAVEFKIQASNCRWSDRGNQ
ncbi:uncharacterized protein LOC129596904 [Paramacrobiotus metropolitanus]|uniref:uncharacterized protein LOC129596904 n=1 Tax=Paramacrobiotus metropolitanus TaxID=2943436 RepID=UPI002445925B|nr:uncharacterized protein LOC129596904 [Paramacrobiotus metropolitanus]